MKSKILFVAILFLICFEVFVDVKMIQAVHKTESLGGISQTVGHFASKGQYGVSTGILLSAASSTLMVAGESSREYAEISNLSSVNIYCNMDGTTNAALFQGVTVFASSTVRIGQDFAYTGNIYCIAPSIASTTVYARQ